MASRLPVARATLAYPPYACDFDPNDPNKLVIGGGGGANRSGVANRITVIDASSKDADLTIAGEIDLSRDEDSINTLAVGHTKPAAGKKPTSTVIYAGINSSAAEIEKGKNEHFRTFSLSPAASPAKTGKSAKQEKKSEKTDDAAATEHTLKLAETSRIALFDHVEGDKDAYQRLLRISAPYPGTTKQIGAVATGFAKQPQIALFEVSPNSELDPKGVLELSREATDLDVIQTGPDTFQVAYCSEKELFTSDIDLAKGQFTEPVSVHNLTDTGTGVIPSYKSIRYLAPGFIMALLNLPKSTGSILVAIRLPTTPGEQGRLAVSTKLPKTFAKSTSLSVRNVNPPTTPDGALGETQFFIAVSSGQSLALWTLKHTQLGDLGILVNFYTFATLKDVHPLSITSLTISSLVPADAKVPGSKPTLKLASVSMNNTVAVHSIPLKQVSKKDEEPRYAVAMFAWRPGTGTLILFVLLCIIGVVLPTRWIVNSGAIGDAEKAWQNMDGKNSQTLVGTSTATRSPHDPTPEVLTGSEFISNLLGDFSGVGQDGPYFVHEGEAAENADKPKIQAAVHDEGVHGPAKAWEQLSPKQKSLWKKRLSDAGHWAEDMGETVFKGIVFSEIAGVVAEAVRAAV
ncbi:hypothetical protein F5X68DRAFT_207366 [Plectosphaerella plurivora]|uniref:Guanine nucleotide-exchange factor SEC12 n=1 Tax=Plectosphaerella plurivora TaxID=936078 RepID=A0A9P9ABZ9_9PEZI|nr:hypothetical protein F5X68DRAFT_207366 [Plectosphaerella plurivora]